MCSNHCPDEKGTESQKIRQFQSLWFVATIAPMKRGLKAQPESVPSDNRSGSNHCPDEKGTESFLAVTAAINFLSSNHCPDEKGTERASRHSREHLVH